MITDSHLHFDSFYSNGNLNKIIENAKNANVSKMISVGGSPNANELSIRLASQNKNLIYASAGYDRDIVNIAYNLDDLKKQIMKPLVKAVGETGLDYYYSEENKLLQQELFNSNLSLATEFNKPVIVHSRAATLDTITILKDYPLRTSGFLGVLHCFTLDLRAARELLDIGMMISFSGIITFKNADSLRSIVNYIPNDALLVETDAPYLSPEPKRGTENEPSFIVYTLKRLSELKKISYEEVAFLTSENARRLFNLDKD